MGHLSSDKTVAERLEVSTKDWHASGWTALSSQCGCAKPAEQIYGLASIKLDSSMLDGFLALGNTQVVVRVCRVVLKVLAQA